VWWRVVACRCVVWVEGEVEGLGCDLGRLVSSKTNRPRSQEVWQCRLVSTQEKDDVINVFFVQSRHTASAPST